MDMVNGLERLDNEQPLSASAYKLAGKLIALCNSLYWKTEISIDLKRLACLASCASTHTAWKGRNELVQRGILTIIEEGCKGRPTRYKLANLSQFHAKNAQNPSKYSEEFCAKNALINRPNINTENRAETLVDYAKDYLFL